jgi:hypothetical protein
VAQSWVYRNGLVYELVMLGLYGRHYGARYRAVAGLIPAGSSVVDVCYGPGVLFDRDPRGNSMDYTGIDVNPGFIARVNRRDGRGLLDDLGEGRPLPEADVMLMQANLYQFLPDPAPLVRRMLGAGAGDHRRAGAEPGDERPPVGSGAGTSPDRRRAGGEPVAIHRGELRCLHRRPGGARHAVVGHPGGREKVVVLDPRGGSST